MTDNTKAERPYKTKEKALEKEGMKKIYSNFKKNMCYSLNLGNFLFTLQLVLCLVGTYRRVYTYI